MPNWTALSSLPGFEQPFKGDPFRHWNRLRPPPSSSNRFLWRRPEGQSVADSLRQLREAELQPVPIYATLETLSWTLRELNAEAPSTAAQAARDAMQLLAGDVQIAPDISEVLLSNPAQLNGEQPAKEPESKTAAPRPVLAVIDDRCAFLHRSFRTGPQSSRTRLLAVWDQSERMGTQKHPSPWHPVPEFGYGRELLRNDINGLLMQAQAGSTERSLYAAAEQFIPTREPSWSHGTHVLAMAGGGSNLFNPDAAADLASGSDLIAVQLPASVVACTHGVWLNTYVLDGLHYILKRAPPDVAVVVNISLAGNLGPHDGSSLLERAIDDLIASQQGRLVVVMAAGNSRLQSMHAHQVLQPDQQASFIVQIRDGDRTPNFIDLWIRGSQLDRLKLSITRELGGTLMPEQSGPIACNEAMVLLNADNQPTALACMSPDGQAPNGGGVHAFVGIGHTSHELANAPADLGDWCVSLYNGNSTTVLVHGWIARDDVPRGYPHSAVYEQLVFKSPTPVEPSATISSLAGGQFSITVGGYELRSNGGPSVFEPSGEGFTPQVASGFPVINRPDIFGPASLDGRGVPDCWFLSDETAPLPTSAAARRQQGTSMAAAAVSRQIVNLWTGHKPGTPWFDKTTLLQALASKRPSIRSATAGVPGTAADHWMPP